MIRSLAVLVASTSVAAAQPVAVDVDACVGDGETIARLVELELDARARPAGAAAVHLRCAGDTIVIAVDDRLTAKRVERTLPRADPRVLALAAAELVRASWLELERPRREPVRVWSAGAATQLRSIGDFTSVGIATTAHRELGALRVSGDAVVEHAVARTIVGDVTARSASVALRAGGSLRFGALQLAAGGGVRAGAVMLQGQSTGEIHAARVAGTWWGPIAVLEVHTGDRVRLGLAGEAGHALAATRGTVTMGNALEWGRTFFAGRASLELSW